MCTTPWPPRSVNKSDIEGLSWNPESKWPNDLEGEGQWPPFSIWAKSITGCVSDANFTLVIQPQICDNLLHGEAKFPKILSQNGQITLKVKDPYFQYQLRVSHDACLVQNWWFQVKSLMRYRKGKVKFMDWWTDRWMDRPSLQEKLMSERWPFWGKIPNIIMELDESTARRQLKSPPSLSGRSIHLTLVTKWSWSWSWMTYCHPLCAMSIGLPILRYSYFKIWPWKSMASGKSPEWTLAILGKNSQHHNGTR